MQKKMQEEFESAKSFEATGDYARAAEIYAEISKDPVQGVRASRRRTECLMRLQRWDEARDEVAAVFAKVPPNNRDIKRWLSVRAKMGELAQPADPVTGFVQAACDAGHYTEGPYVLFTAAAPKTGSTSLSVALAAACGATKVNVLTLPPDADSWGRPWWPAIEAARGCALVNHCHLSPRPDILAEFSKRPWTRIAVHLRNPFETIESTIDMVIRQRSPNILSSAPHLAKAPDESLRAWVISHYLPALAKYWSDWIAIADAGHPSVIRISTMDEMRAQGQDALAQRIARDLPGVSPRTVATEPQRTSNRLDGNKAVKLTDAETQQVRAAMPDSLLRRFGWA